MSEKGESDGRFRLLVQARSTWKAEGISTLLGMAYRYVGAKFFGEKFYYKPVIDSILSYSTENRTFIDIGAHIGRVTTSVAQGFERCLAFEPLPQNNAKLRQAVESKKLTNCQIFNCALGDQSGVATLYCSKSSTTNNSLIKRERLKNCVEVPVNTLDQIVEETKAEEPFLIKIDVEGYEPFVLRGAHQTLAKKCTIISEFWPWGLNSGGFRAEAYLEYMKTQGYDACDLKGHPIPQKKLNRFCELGENDRFVETDILFKKRGLEDHVGK